jgi:hypothetical protein
MPVDPWDTHRRPPCWAVGQTCPNPCAKAHYDHVVYNHVPLAGPWAGWRLAGRYLVGPGPRRSSVRITPERLRGLLWAEAARERTEAAKVRSSGFRVGDVVPLFPQR